MFNFIKKTYIKSKHQAFYEELCKIQELKYKLNEKYSEVGNLEDEDYKNIALNTLRTNEEKIFDNYVDLVKLLKDNRKIDKKLNVDFNNYFNLCGTNTEICIRKNGDIKINYMYLGANQETVMIIIKDKDLFNLKETNKIKKIRNLKIKRNLESLLKDPNKERIIYHILELPFNIQPTYYNFITSLQWYINKNIEFNIKTIMYVDAKNNKNIYISKDNYFLDLLREYKFNYDIVFITKD